MNDPLISIITPVYNGSLFLNQAVQSVLNQTNSNWEMLIIDDGSNDDSYTKALELSKRESRIRVLHHLNRTNKGVSSTRNLGIDNSKGKYIAFLDSDDEWLPNKLQTQLAIMENSRSVVLTYCKAVTIDQDGYELAKSIFNYSFPRVCGNGTEGIIENALAKMIADDLWMPCSTVLSKTEDIKAIGGFNKNFKWQVEDHYLFTLLAKRGPVFFSDQILAKYRLHDNSYTIRNQWLKSMVEYYEMLFDELPRDDRFLVAREYLRFWKNYLRNKPYAYNYSELQFILKTTFKILTNKSLLPAIIREKLTLR